jgi:RNA recognition motif-containing protein
VLDVVALKTMKMRGQAHIVYRDIQTATQAMRSLDGFEIFGQKMVCLYSLCLIGIASDANTAQKITYAKSKSNVVAKLDGTFKLPQTASAAHVEVTDLQQSIFNAPVPGQPAPATTAAPAASLKPVGTEATDAASPASRGTKRPRDDEEEDESDSDVAMEEDSDDE